MQKYNCHFISEKIREGGQLIDVRSQVEFNQGALDGAINIPITSVQSLIDNIKKSKPVLLYCRTGVRSEMVKNHLEQLGFVQVHNIGGIQQFSGC